MEDFQPAVRMARKKQKRTFVKGVVTGVMSTLCILALLSMEIGRASCRERV